MSPHGLSIARATNKSKNALAMSRGGQAPRAGDVLASGRRARADIHAISVVPSEAHTSVVRYPEAIEKVRELARRLGVGGCYTSNQTHYVRVATHRPEGDAT